MIPSQKSTQRTRSSLSPMGLGHKDRTDPTFGKVIIKSNYPDGMKDAKVDHSPELTIKILARQLCNNDQKTQKMFDEIAEFLPENLEDDPLKVMQASKKFQTWIEADVFHDDAPSIIQEFYEKYKGDCDTYLRNAEKEETPEGVKAHKDWFILYVKGKEKERQAYDTVKALAKEQEQNIEEYGIIDPEAKKEYLARNAQKFDQLLQQPKQPPRSIIHDYKEMIAAIHKSLEASIHTQKVKAKGKSKIVTNIKEIPHITDKDKEDLHELMTLLDKNKLKETIDEVQGMTTGNPSDPVPNRRHKVREYLKNHDLLKVKYLSRRIKRSRELEPQFKVNLDKVTSNIKINAADDLDTKTSKINMAKGLEKLLDYVEGTIKSANSIKKLLGKSKRKNITHEQLKYFLKMDNDKRNQLLEALGNEATELDKDNNYKNFKGALETNLGFDEKKILGSKKSNKDIAKKLGFLSENHQKTASYIIHEFNPITANNVLNLANNLLNRKSNDVSGLFDFMRSKIFVKGKTAKNAHQDFEKFSLLAEKIKPSLHENVIKTVDENSTQQNIGDVVDIITKVIADENKSDENITSDLNAFENLLKNIRPDNKDFIVEFLAVKTDTQNIGDTLNAMNKIETNSDLKQFGILMTRMPAEHKTNMLALLKEQDADHISIFLDLTKGAERDTIHNMINILKDQTNEDVKISLNHLKGRTGENIKEMVNFLKDKNSDEIRGIIADFREYGNPETS